MIALTLGDVSAGVLVFIGMIIGAAVMATVMLVAVLVRER